MFTSTLSEETLAPRAQTPHLNSALGIVLDGQEKRAKKRSRCLPGLTLGNASCKRHYAPCRWSFPKQTLLESEYSVSSFNLPGGQLTSVVMTLGGGAWGRP